MLDLRIRCRAVYPVPAQRRGRGHAAVEEGSTYSWFAEHGETEVEVRSVNGRGKGFEKDVDDHFGVTELGIELVAAPVSIWVEQRDTRARTVSGQPDWRTGRSRHIGADSTDSPPSVEGSSGYTGLKGWSVKIYEMIATQGTYRHLE